MTAETAKEVLQKRADFLNRYTSPFWWPEWVEKQKEAVRMAIKVIEVFEDSLHEEGAYLVEYKDGKLKLNIGGKEYEI